MNSDSESDSPSKPQNVQATHSPGHGSGSAQANPSTKDHSQNGDSPGLQQTSGRELDDSHDPQQVGRADTMSVISNNLVRNTVTTQQVEECLPWRRNMYASRWFSLLVALIMIEACTCFLLIIILQGLFITDPFGKGTIGGTGATALQAGNQVLTLSFAATYLIPGFLGALVLWWILALFSSSIWRCVWLI